MKRAMFCPKGCAANRRRPARTRAPSALRFPRVVHGCDPPIKRRWAGGGKHGPGSAHNRSAPQGAGACAIPLPEQNIAPFNPGPSCVSHTLAHRASVALGTGTVDEAWKTRDRCRFCPCRARPAATGSWRRNIAPFIRPFATESQTSARRSNAPESDRRSGRRRRRWFRGAFSTGCPRVRSPDNQAPVGRRWETRAAGENGRRPPLPEAFPRSRGRGLVAVHGEEVDRLVGAPRKLRYTAVRPWEP